MTEDTGPISLDSVRGIVGVGMSVTPFVPPPFGPAATGTLAVFNFIVGMLDVKKPPDKPFQDLKNSLEAFYTASDLTTQLAILAGQRAHLANSPVVQNLPTPIEKLTDTDINGAIADLFNSLGDTSSGWIKSVSDANDQIWKLLKACNTDNFDATLASLISGITLQLLMENASIEIKAIDASVAYRHKKMDDYGTYVSSWTARVQTAANDIGKTQVGDWDETAIKEGLESFSRIPQIEAWMAQVKEQRLNQISDVHKFSYQVQRSGGMVDVMPESHSGWSWNDSHDPDSQSDTNNLVENTRDSGWRWFLGEIEHKDQADSSHDDHVKKISKQIDDSFEPHRELMKTWVTFLEGFHELLPPSQPLSPKACSMQSGLAVPQGPWVEGADVRYALMAVSKKGPSALSDWSDSFKTGKTAFATVTQLGPAPTADSLDIYRQIRPPGASDWGDMVVVGSVGSPFPSDYNDTFLSPDW